MTEMGLGSGCPPTGQQGTPPADYVSVGEVKGVDALLVLDEEEQVAAVDRTMDTDLGEVGHLLSHHW